MRVVELWRYPVKSLQGEPLTEVSVGPQGLTGDRQWALFDTTTGLGLTARRVPQLLFARAALRPDASVEITLPDGRIAAGDRELSDWLHRPVRLASVTDDVTRRYENPADFEHEDTGGWEPFDGSAGAFHDTADAVLTLVSQATLGDWDSRRFRANLLVDGSGEDALVGEDLMIGSSRLRARLRVQRCVMVTRPQPDGIERDVDVLRTIHRQRQGCLAIGLTVRGDGTIRVGDLVTGAATG